MTENQAAAPAAAPAAEPKKRADPELSAVRRIATILEGLGASSQRRVLSFLADRALPST